jgi:hypothetical protein
MAIASTSAPIIGGELRSNPPASPALFPALKASHRTRRNAMPVNRTSVQIVELSRDFMPSSKILVRSPSPKNGYGE